MILRKQLFHDAEEQYMSPSDFFLRVRAVRGESKNQKEHDIVLTWSIVHCLPFHLLISGIYASGTFVF